MSYPKEPSLDEGAGEEAEEDSIKESITVNDIKNSEDYNKYKMYKRDGSMHLLNDVSINGGGVTYSHFINAKSKLTQYVYKK